jgi:hypothetical protein
MAWAIVSSDLPLQLNLPRRPFYLLPPPLYMRTLLQLQRALQRHPRRRRRFNYELEVDFLGQGILLLHRRQIKLEWGTQWNGQRMVSKLLSSQSEVNLE